MDKYNLSLVDLYYQVFRRVITSKGKKKEYLVELVRYHQESMRENGASKIQRSNLECYLTAIPCL